jgi:hypothetical protein
MTVNIPRVVLIALALTVGAVFVFAGVTSTAAFSAFNPDWDGTSSLRETAETTGSEPVVLSNTTQYEAYGDGDIAFVLAPSENYTAADVDRIDSFLNRGGTLVVAVRDGQAGRALLGDLDAGARPVGPILRDERNHYRSPALPIAVPADEHPLIMDVPSVTLNYGTALAVTNTTTTVVVETSAYAYLDRDGSGNLSETESVRSYPVATVEHVGEGQLVTVSDPSVFINTMQERDGNRAFAVALTNGTNHTVIDISKKNNIPILIEILLIIQNSIWIQTGLGLTIFGAIGFGRRYIKIKSDPELLTPFENEKFWNR